MIIDALSWRLTLLNTMRAQLKEFDEIRNTYSNDEDFEEHLAEHYKNETVIRVIFKGEATKEPLIQTLAYKYNVTTNILAGRIEYIQNKQLGSLTFSVVGEPDNTEKFVNHLIDQVNDVEVNVYGK